MGIGARTLPCVVLLVLCGCSTDCDDAVRKLEFCDLPIPAALGAECDDEGALACQARCLRDTSCSQIAESMAGARTAYDRCAAPCGGGELLAGTSGSGGQGGATSATGGGGGGGGGAEQ